MNLTRCKKGHFYNAEVHQQCPHCLTNDRLDREETRQARPFYKEASPRSHGVAGQEAATPGRGGAQGTASKNVSGHTTGSYEH